MAFIVTSAAAYLTAQFITVTGITSLAAAEAVYATAVVATTVGIYELGQALVPGAPDPAAQKQTTRQAVGPRLRGYGQVKVGGLLAFLDDRKSYLYQVIMLNSGEIDSFVSHWLGDVELTLDGSGNVTVPTTYFDGDSYYAIIDVRLGTASQTAFSRLLTGFAGEWTAAHQLNGIACSLVTLLSPPPKNFSQVFPAGLPAYNAVLRTSKLWDPRDVSQDPDDSTTWAYA